MGHYEYETHRVNVMLTEHDLDVANRIAESLAARGDRGGRSAAIRTALREYNLVQVYGAADLERVLHAKQRPTAGPLWRAAQLCQRALANHVLSTVEPVHFEHECRAMVIGLSSELCDVCCGIVPARK